MASTKNADQPATLEDLRAAVQEASRAYDEAHAKDAPQAEQEALYHALDRAQQVLDVAETLDTSHSVDPVDPDTIVDGQAVDITPEPQDPDGRDVPEEPPHPAEPRQVRQEPATRALSSVPVPQDVPLPSAVAVRPPTTVAVGPVREPVLARPTGMVAMEDILASMTEEDFDARLQSLVRGQARLARIQRDLMVEDVDYGRVGNISKPTLLKPGAEKLARFYGLVADFTNTLTLGDGVTVPTLSYTARCDLHFQDISGPIVGVGYGTANSWEARYRWRRGSRSCPACGATKVRRSKNTPGQWWCPQDPGCGANFDAGSPEAIALETQEVGDVENKDPHDLAVTLLKMAEKRAHVDGVLRATATSGLFTQDVEDQVGQVDDAPVAARPAQEARRGPVDDGQDSGDPRAVPTPSQARQAAPRAQAPAQGATRTFTPGPLDAKCPKHAKPWRSNARGWYCPSKDATTEGGWCIITAHPQWVAGQ